MLMEVLQGVLRDTVPMIPDIVDTYAHRKSMMESELIHGTLGVTMELLVNVILRNCVVLISGEFVQEELLMHPLRQG